MYDVDNELYALRLTFYEEAEERLVELEESLHALGTRGDDRDMLNSIFRAVHSIKGGSAACDHAELTRYAHAFESLLSSLRKGALSVDRPLLDVLLQAKDVLDALVCAARANRPGSEDERVASSLAVIEAALAQLPASAEEVIRAEDIVDLSAGFALWDGDTDPSPAISTALPVRHASSVPPASTEQDEPTPRLQTLPVENRRMSAKPSAAPQSARPSLFAATKSPRPVCAPKTVPPTREPRVSLDSKKPAAARARASEPVKTWPDRAMDGVVVRVGPQLYVLPTSSVERFLQPELSALYSVPNTGDLLLTEFGAVSLMSLERLLGCTPRRLAASSRVAVLLRTGSKHVALLVDEVLTQGDVAVKSLEQNVGKVRGVCGAVVLDHSVALVLECDALFASTRVASLDPNAV